MHFCFLRVSTIHFAAFRGHGDHERWIPHCADGKDAHGAQQWGAIAQYFWKWACWGIWYIHSSLNSVKLIDKYCAIRMNITLMLPMTLVCFHLEIVPHAAIIEAQTCWNIFGVYTWVCLKMDEHRAYSGEWQFYREINSSNLRRDMFRHVQQTHILPTYVFSHALYT